MRKLLFAVAFLLCGGLMFSVGTPAQALTANTLGEMTKAAPQSNVTKTWCCHRRYYYRYYRPHYHYYYRRYYVRPYYYRRHYHHHHHHHW